MQMCIMLAINPPHSRNILEGIKRVEWRKTLLPVGRRTFLYETKNGGGCGMVVGEVVLGPVRSYRILTEKSSLFDVDIHFGCVSKKELKKYAGKRRFLYAHELKDVIRYSKPAPLSDFLINRPPLSWCYCIAPESLYEPDYPWL